MPRRSSAAEPHHGREEGMLHTLARTSPPLALRRLALGLALVAAAALPAVAADTVTLAVDASRAGPKIDRNLFGQFAEHLGTGIYDGVWVGPGLPDPQHPRHPQRRGGRPQGAQGAERALARRLLRGRVPLAQGHRPGARRDPQPQLGRRHGVERVRHARVPGLRRADRRRGVPLRQRRLGHAAGGGRVAGVPDRRAADDAGAGARRQRPSRRPTRSPPSASATRAGTAAAT